ncbi:MAG: GIY-YIG nuclease family protein [Promethearchaeota archaeon]|jgi:group I intron endonuclease
MDANNIIYAWLDQNGDPFYVGKTKCLKTRMRHHRWRMDSGINLPKYNKLRKLLREGFKWDIQVLEDGIPDEEWQVQECYWIKFYRDQGCKLYNLTDGGEGMLNASNELKKRLSEAHKGHSLSEDTKRKISESNKGKEFSKEHKKKLSISRKRRITTEETRQKCSETSRGKINIRKYKCTSPDGVEYITECGLTEFCRQHGLGRANMSGRGSSKGWSCERLNE